ncbi:MAG: hypothetical protein BWY69_01540 [Planctomycetes bacterium ADurb.Bin401]|nr:MAG: hypothetical protein BWY69_01540 [Planctomycetes bacterium ADurb.Bin401]
MSQIDTEINGSEEQEQRNEKLVDVSEAIRYRKRAQLAEQKKTILEQELADRNSEIEKLNKNLAQMNVERQLIEKLVWAGVSDLEGALIIGKNRIEQNSKATASEVVEQLKKEKSYLFNDARTVTASGKTSGVKDKLSGTKGVLERAAKKAAQSGSRTDLQEYLRARRTLI